MKITADDEIISKSEETALSIASALVGYAIGGPFGAVVAGSCSSGVQLVQEIAKSWNERRQRRISKIIENAILESGRSIDEITGILLYNTDCTDSLMLMIQQLLYTDPELDELFSHLVAEILKSEEEGKQRRLIVLSDSLKGINKVQLMILMAIYKAGGRLASNDIANTIEVPEMELRNCVRDLELRGMIIDNGAEPPVWEIRELGIAIVRFVKTLEVD